jgi:hypothetical protein
MDERETIRLFLSYRRKDAAGLADRLRIDLNSGKPGKTWR